MGRKPEHETWARGAEAVLEERARRIAELEGEVASTGERLAALELERAAVEEKLAAGLAETEVFKAELESARGAAATAQVPQHWASRGLPARSGPCTAPCFLPYNCVLGVAETARYCRPIG